MGNMQTGEAPVSSSAALAAGWAALPPEYAIPETAPSLAESQAYCRRLATSHYENFSVVTWFLPKRLHRHFYSLYAYCRISDDLGDEVGNAEQSLLLLDAWEAELNATYESLNGEGVAPASSPAGSRSESGNEKQGMGNGKRETGNGIRASRHPVFIALREAIRECHIPREPLADLLKAFRQDQTVQRYETFDELRGYCRYSADPVGRLVLYLCGYSDPELHQLSDYTCTALQLANFWQDVSVDYGKGRIYLPLEDMRRFGVAESDIAQRRATPQIREMMRFEVERARDWFERGLPLISRLDRELAVDIELFSRGGQEILNAIERRNYDVLSARPSIPKSRKLWLVARAALRAKLIR